MKILLTIACFAIFLHTGFAATLEVRRFAVNDEETTISTKHRFDNQKRMCALIKVTLNVESVKFSGRPSIAEQSASGNMYFLYVSPVENSLIVEAPGYTRLTYQTPALLSGRVYEMEIVANNSDDEGEEKGTIYFKSDPQADIFLNEIPQGKTPHFQTGLMPGTYSVRLSAEGYRDFTNKNVLVESGKTTDVVTKLTPLPGTAVARATTTNATNSLTAAAKPAPAPKLKEKPAETHGWFAGLSIGVVFPNNYTANYYNGSPENINSFERLFNNPPGSTVLADIEAAIGYTIDTIGYPRNMAYNVAPNFGLYGGYIFKKKNRIFATFDYHRLKTNGTLVLYHDQITPGNKDNYTTASVRGKEDRYHINLTYSREFSAGEFANWYLLGGININNVTVKENKVSIPILNSNDYLEYSIKYVGYNPDGTPLPSYDYEEGGTGFGLFAGAGLRLMFSKSFSLDPEIQLYYSQFNLKGYKAFKPYFQINLRMNLLTFWNKNSQTTPEDW